MAQVKSKLSPSRRELIELMQRINYGCIEGLHVLDGDPVFDPMPTVSRVYSFGKENGPNTSSNKDSFILKKKVSELFEVFDRERLLTIKELKVDNGLPLRMTVAEVARV